MRFPQKSTESSKSIAPSYNLYAYSKVKSHDFGDLIKMSEQILSFLAEPYTGAKQSLTSFYLKPLYNHYDDFYKSCLAKLRSGAAITPEILKNLKTILSYEYVFSKETGFLAASEDVSQLVELLLYLEDPDMLILILRILAEKLKEADYRKDWEQETLRWQVNLGRLIQVYYEFFSETSFELLLENFSPTYFATIERILLTSLSNRIQRISSLDSLNKLIQELISSQSALNDSSIAQIKTFFAQGRIDENNETNPDFYEAAAIISLLSLCRNWSQKTEAKLLNFFIVIERVRLSLSSMKSPVFLPKLKSSEHKWSQLAFKCLDILNTLNNNAELPLEYLCLLQDLVPVYKFILMRSRTNNQIFVIYTFNTILKNLKQLSSKQPFCMPVNSLLDEVLIEWLASMKRCIFLGYDKLILEIGQHLVQFLLDPSLTHQIGPFALKKMSNFCSEILASDDRFSTSLVNLNKYLELFSHKILHIFSTELKNHTYSIYAILKYFTDVIMSDRNESSDIKVLLGCIKDAHFVQSLITFLSKGEIHDILNNNPSLLVQIVLFIIEYTNKKDDDLAPEEYLNFVSEVIKVFQSHQNLPSEGVNRIVQQLLDKTFLKPILKNSLEASQYIGDLLIAFFHYSALDGTSVEVLGKYLKLNKSPQDHSENKSKIEILFSVLNHYIKIKNNLEAELFNPPQSASKSLSSKYEAFSAEVLLGPLRLVQIMLNPLYDKHDTPSNEILGQCKAFLPRVSELLLSPIMLFAPKEYLSSDKKLLALLKRVPYLAFLANLFKADYIDIITDQLRTVSSTSDVKLSHLESFLPSAESPKQNLGTTLPLINNSIQNQTLSHAEYTLFNTIDPLSVLTEFLTATEIDSIFIDLVTKKQSFASMKKLEDALPSFLDTLLTFSKSVFIAAEQNGAKDTRTKVSQEWSKTLDFAWLGLASFAAFQRSNHLFQTITQQTFQHLIGVCTAAELPVPIRQHFVAGACAMPAKLRAGNTFFKANLNALLRTIEKLDAFSIINSFVKELVQKPYNADNKHTHKHIESFYELLSNDSRINIEFKTTLEYLSDLTSLQNNIRSKDLFDLLENIKRHLSNIILQQLKGQHVKARSQDNIETLIKKASETQSLNDTIDLVESLAALYIKSSIQSQENFDWSQLHETEYPIKEETLSQVLKAFVQLSKIICSQEGDFLALQKEEKEDLLKNFCNLFERITHDIRAYLSYHFLKGKSDIKHLSQLTVSSLLELSHLTLLDIFGDKAFFKSLWLTIYNIILIDQDLAIEIIHNGLFQTLLTKEYLDTATWGLSTSILSVFDLYCFESLPPRELIEVNLKSQFALKQDVKQPLKTLLASDFFNFAAKSLEEQDLRYVFRTCLSANKAQQTSDTQCEINPDMLMILQSNENNNATPIDQGILQHLSEPTRDTLDILINALVANYSHEAGLQKKSTENKKGRRLTTELLYHLVFILAKYPYLYSYVFTKKVDPKIMKAEGLPDKFPYAKLINSADETPLFLDFLLRVILKIDHRFTVLILDFVRRSGVVMSVIKEDEKKPVFIDLNNVIHSKSLQLINEIIDEDINSGQILSSYDSFEMIKSLFYPLWHLQTMHKVWRSEMQGNFSRLTLHKMLDWVLKVDKKRFQDNPDITNIEETISLLTNLGETVLEGGLTNMRAEKYREMLNSLIDYQFVDKEEGLILQCKAMFDKFAQEAEEQKQSDRRTKKFEMTREHLQKRLFHVLQEKAEDAGLGFKNFIRDNSQSGKNFESVYPVDLNLVQNIYKGSENIMKRGRFYFMETKGQPKVKDPEIGRPSNPILNIVARNLDSLDKEFAYKQSTAAILDMLAEGLNVVEEKPNKQETAVIEPSKTNIQIEEAKEEETKIEEIKQGKDMMLLKGEGDVGEDECMEKVIDVLNTEPEFAESFEQMLVNGVFQDLNKSMDRAVASALLQSALEEYVGSKSLRDRVLKKLFTDKNETKEKSEEEEKIEDEKYVEMKRMYEKYILPSSSAIYKDRFNAKNVQENWLRRLCQVRRNNKHKIEAVLLHLRYSLTKNCSLEKLNVADLENIVTFRDEVEREHFFAEVYEYASDHLAETVKERAAQANECVSHIEKCIGPQPQDSLPLEKFLEKYKAEVESTIQKGEKPQEPEFKEENELREEDLPTPRRRRRRSRGDSDNESGRSSEPSSDEEEFDIGRATRPRLTSKVVFCKDEIDYNELMPGKREFVKTVSQENAIVDAKVLRAFTNFICCTDTQIESLVEFLYEDSLGAKNARDEYQIMELIKQICINPMNEIKVLDTILFLLLNPHIYKAAEHETGFPYNVAQRTSILGLKSSGKLYTTFAQNALYMINYIIKALSLRFVYIPLPIAKSFSIKTIQNLREKHRNSDRTLDMLSMFDLLIAVADVPEIRENKDLEDTIHKVIKLVLETTCKFKNNHYSLEVTHKHFGYLIKSFTFDEVTKSFQGSPKAFLNILPSILQTILSSLKPASEKAHEMIEKLKDVETKSEKEREKLSEPIVKTHEFTKITGAVYKTVEVYFNYLFRSTSLLWSSNEENNIDEDTFKVIESSLSQVNQELEEENLQLFMVSIYEILDIYGRIVGKQNLTTQTLQKIPAMTKLVEFGIHYYTLTEMKKRLDKELAEERELSPLPKLSRMKSKDGNSELPSLMKRSFSHIRKEKKFDFDSIFSNFGLAYGKVLSDMSCNYNHSNITGGLILFLCEKYPFLVNIDAQREIMRRMYFNHFYQGGEPSRREIELDRRNIIDSLIEYIENSDRKKLGMQFRIKFKGESGIDQGGLIREFYTLLSHEFFDPDKGLFQLSANKLSVQPRPDSWIIPNHLKLFELAGIITAKALVGDFIIDCAFTKSFLKHCLGRKILISDLEELDTTLTQNLKWVLDNDVTDLDLNFTYETEILGEKVRKELVEGGYDLPVTEDNKKEYVMMFCEAFMIKEIGPQMESFLKGFRSLLPARMLSHISPSDLGLLISGTPTIDLEDLKANSSYEGFSSNSKVVKWFWEIVTEFTQEELASLMYFISGTAKVPVGGFKNRPLRLEHSSELEQEDLPVAHTCFYTLDLPEYKSKAKMREKLLLAIFEGKEGFHIA